MPPIKQRFFCLPYSFDAKLLAGLNILEVPQSSISSIYLPPYIDDYRSIQRYDIFPDKKKYYDHLNMINSQFPNKIQLLLQQTDNLIDNNILKKYINNFNISKFCVGSIKQAKKIKEILPEAEITGSITMHITNEQLKQQEKEYSSYFDNFVLDFTYNRNIDKIKKLSNNFKYTLIINSKCSSNCNSNLCYFSDDYGTFKCPYTKENFFNKSIIRPTDLVLFDNYITNYKIVERGYPTSRILRTLLTYNLVYDYFPADESLYKKP